VIHLDTNVAIALLNARPPTVRAKFDAARAAGDDIFMSSIVFHELMFGAAASVRRGENEAKIYAFVANGVDLLPFEADDAAHAGEIRARLKILGAPIGPYDLLIAAHARRHSALLVTANTRELSRVPGLQVTDWAA